MFAVLMKEKATENVVQPYFTCILAHKDGGMAISCDNGTKFKNKVLKEVSDQVGTKQLISSLFHTQSNAKVENVHIFF